MTWNLRGFDNHKYPTMISRLNTDQHSTMDKNEQTHILTLTFVTLTFNHTENNDIYLIFGVFYPTHQQNTWFMCILPIMQILHILTLNCLTLTLTQGHMISTIYCPFLWSVILKKNKLNICSYTWAVGGNVKTYILMTFDLENVPIDPKINRLRPWPLPKVAWYQPYIVLSYGLSY